MKRNFGSNVARALIILAGSVIAPSASNAAPVIYTYTGSTFAYLESCGTCIGGQPVTTVDHVSAYFELANPLGANFDGFVTPTDWAISDGISTLSVANAILTPTGNSSFGQVYVATDSLGAIHYWQMFAGTQADISNGGASDCLAGTATCIGVLTALSDLAGACCALVVEDYSFYYPFGGAEVDGTAVGGTLVAAAA